MFFLEATFFAAAQENKDLRSPEKYKIKVKSFGFNLSEGWKTAAEDYLASDKIDEDQSVAMKQEQSRKQMQGLDHFLIMVSPPIAHTMQ